MSSLLRCNALALFAVLAGSCAPAVDSIYNQIGIIKGQVEVLSKGTKGPAPGAYFVLQRVGCTQCLIGVLSDVDGRYTVYVGIGKYRIYCYDPEGDHRDLLSKGQPRELTVKARPADTKFDILLEIPDRQ